MDRLLIIRINIQFCMKLNFTTVLVIVTLTGVFPCSGLQAQNWELVWSDEFDVDTLDESKWSYQYGTGASEGLTGWGNNELQYYTDREENIYVDDGKLHIVARQESYQGMNYTSARIRSIHNGDWKYGRFEIRARLPKGQGIWPAIWMMPTDNVYGGWAASGEIDIMELVGHDPHIVHGTLHYGGSWPENVHTGDSYRLETGDFSDDFHTFALEWEKGEIRWYVDGEHYQTQNNWYTEGENFPAPFDQRFHMIMNLAVGGDWPGSPDHTTTFPQEMVVDYVRVYQDPDANGGNDGPGTGVGGPATPGDLIPVTLPLTFEDEDFNWNLAFFGFSGGAAGVVDNPYPDEINDSGRTGKMVKDGGEFWGGAFMHLEDSFVFDEENHTITMKVWSPRTDVPVLMKVEQRDGEVDYELARSTTTSGEWEELTWDMSGAGYEREWDLITLIFDIREGQEGDGGENFTWYFDDLYVHAGEWATAADDLLRDVSSSIELRQNYPNPFNPVTSIRFRLADENDVRLEVFDMTGRRVAVLIDDRIRAGEHSVNFNASGLASGVYVYRLQTGSGTYTRKMLLMR